MRIARRADHKRMAWKNGQGLTEEVAVFPPGSDAESFDWRLSIAHVAADGPFSLFAGVDRTIALLDGAGLMLDLPDGRTIDLVPGGAPFSFPGEWTISGRNLDGPTIDLNVMTRRRRCTHTMQRLTMAPGSVFTAGDFGWVIFNAPARVAIDGEAFSLDRIDALSLQRADTFVNRADTPAEVVSVTFGPADRKPFPAVVHDGGPA